MDGDGGGEGEIVGGSGVEWDIRLICLGWNGRDGRREVARFGGGWEITVWFRERDVKSAGLRVQRDKRNQEDNRRM